MAPDVSPVPKRRWGWVGLGVLLLGALSWLGWCDYDFRCAVREAEAAGFTFTQSPGPLALIREDWHDAFRADTWFERSRTLNLPFECDLAQLQTLLLRLRPTVLVAPECRNVSAIRGLTGLCELFLSDPDVKDLAPLADLAQLQYLGLTGCTGVVDLTPLRGLAHLERLDLSGCTGVVDLAPLAGLAQLQYLGLTGCTGVVDLAPLRGLAQLQRLDLRGCTGVVDLAPLAGLAQLQSLDLTDCTGVVDLTPLAGLAQLELLYLFGCTGLSAEAVAAFRKSHPKTDILGR